MDRRKFIRKAGLGVVITGAFSFPALAGTVKEPFEEEGYYQEFETEGFNLLVRVPTGKITELKSAATGLEMEVEIVLNTNADFSTLLDVRDHVGTFTYKIEKVKEIFNSLGMTQGYELSAQIKEGTAKPSSIIGNKIICNLFPFAYIKLPKNPFDLSSGNWDSRVCWELDYRVMEGAEDCFLTSACVAYKGLLDDGYTLNTLRSFRDNYMSQSNEGRQLVAEYHQIGPELIYRINQQKNADEFWDHIYEVLIKPSLSKIEIGQMKEAMQYYAGYVEKLSMHLACSR
jgi:hypothetical protein